MNKELEALLDLKKEALKDIDFSPHTIDELDIWEKRIKTNEKIIKNYNMVETALKALKLIKEKEINVQELFDFVDVWGEHNGIYMYDGQRPYEKRINKEEYNLLKEVLLWSAKNV